ncbi:ornithine cyclodeaminase [Paenibacillus cremeus]|uniref:Ornithine cyclodeaminase n=1 Tax=Paenibacillus cremeus TaxID=2163881 RepID=A0A559JNP4_9BACL|nr:ornithine cyclodeaminase [Paenibacillus cremeus]TVY01494.1 ornithine cyclodeaminase [Paenibacillus cremeus]
MGFLDTIKKMLSPSPASSNDKQLAVPSAPAPNPVIKRSEYHTSIKKPLFKQGQSFSIQVEIEETWDLFFSAKKTDGRYIGFESRSRKKFRLYYNDDSLIVVGAAKTLEVIGKEQINRYLYQDTPLENMGVIEANERGAIWGDKEHIGFMDFESATGYVYEFQWQPFRAAMGNGFWLVGTRETYNGPGEIYCFSMDGSLLWGIRFLEKVDTMFGTIEATAYHLDVSKDSTDILVSSMDRLYRFNTDGTLSARIAISELKEAELQEKELARARKNALPPRTQEEVIHQLAEEMAEQFISGFRRLSFNSPFTGFAHDPSTDMLFILESEGRLTGWDRHGKLVWINTFKENGRYIHWLDDKLVVSFQSGHTFWLDRDGKFFFGAKLPEEAWTIDIIPGQEKYLVVCQDNRLYELDKTTGSLVAGTEGHPGMRLFKLAGHNVFYDGTQSAMGYFWLAPEVHDWTIYEAQHVTNTAKGTENQIIAPEIKATKPFRKKWNYTDPKGRYLSNRIIDVESKKMYFVQMAERDLDSNPIGSGYKTHYNLVCYDFDVQKQWSIRFKEHIFTVALSPDGNAIFVGDALKDALAYAPGHLVMLNKQGKKIGKIEIPAIRFYIDKVNSDEAIISFTMEAETESYRLYKNEGTWAIGELAVQDEENEFGAGLREVHLDQYQLKRADKKKYEFKHEDHSAELKVSAAIYEAFETPSMELLIRLGNKTIQLLNDKAEKVWEIKTKGNISSITKGNEGFLVLTKEEALYYDFSGQVKWRLSPPPSSYQNNAYWLECQGVFLWFVGNQNSCIIATISEEGNIINSQQFDKMSLHDGIQINEKEGYFIIHFSESITCLQI